MREQSSLEQMCLVSSKLASDLGPEAISKIRLNFTKNFRPEAEFCLLGGFQAFMEVKRARMANKKAILPKVTFGTKILVQKVKLIA